MATITRQCFVMHAAIVLRMVIVIYLFHEMVQKLLYLIYSLEKVRATIGCLCKKNWKRNPKIGGFSVNSVDF